jgi:hypothetical protein
MSLNNRSRLRQIVYLVLVFGCLVALVGLTAS